MKISEVGGTNIVPIILREEMGRVAFLNPGASNQNINVMTIIENLSC